MKKKIIAILVCMLVAIWSAFNVAASTNVEKQILVTQGNNSKQVDNTLITEIYGNRVIEVDNSGTIVWVKSGLGFPTDAERLANGNTLIAELGSNRVIEIDSGGNMIWNYTALNGPWDAERLANGNTLISDFYNNRVIEVDSGGTVVWQKAGLNMSVDAERLANGNTLIAEVGNDRVIEVDTSGTIVWQKAGLSDPVDAERLANGNTLITEAGIHLVSEVDSSGNIVWVYNTTGSGLAFDAERLVNGNTLITEYYTVNHVIEVDSSGTIVWQKSGLNWPTDAERINAPPTAPTITGQTSGKTGTSYEYTFNATDPEGDDVKYYIDWGDNTTDETGFNASGTNVTVKHTWSNDGTYNITAKAQDIHGALGPEGTLKVEIPRSREVNNPLLLRLFERLHNLFPILKRLLLRLGLQ